MADLLVPEMPLGDVQTLGVLVVDESGSMGRYGDAPPRALEAYLADLREGPDAAITAATIVTFSSAPALLCGPISRRIARSWASLRARPDVTSRKTSYVA